MKMHVSAGIIVLCISAALGARISNRTSDSIDKQRMKDDLKQLTAYSKMQSKLRSTEAELKEALERKKVADAKLANAVALEHEAKKTDDAAVQKYRKAEIEADALHLKMGAGGSAVAEAASLVAGKVRHMQDSQKKLASAREHLKSLQEERKQAEREVADAEGAKADSAATIDASIKAEAKKAVEVRQQEEEHAKAMRNYADQSADYKSSALPLEQAASRLKLLRHSEIDHNGGVFYNGWGITTGPPTTPPPPPSRPLSERVWPRPSGAPMAAAPHMFSIVLTVTAVVGVASFGA